MAYSPSEKYPGAVDVDPDYQGGKFRDNNPSTTNNGSPLKAIDRNELLARDEAIMNDAGFEYNGLPDTPQDSQLFKAYKASLGNGANLLSNHNFLIQTPDDSHPLPSATPTSYPPGYQIFSGVFANETTGITNLTYIDGRVFFSGGDFYMPVPNTGGVERLTDFAASVADFDGKPRTRGVSFALVGDEYRVTVGIDALEDESAVLTPLGSVKFEQGSVATRHESESLSARNLRDYTYINYQGSIGKSAVENMISKASVGERCCTGGTFWVRASNSFGDVRDFNHLSEIHATDFGIVGDGLSDDTDNLIKLAAAVKDNCTVNLDGLTIDQVWKGTNFNNFRSSQDPNQTCYFFFEKINNVTFKNGSLTSTLDMTNGCLIMSGFVGCTSIFFKGVKFNLQASGTPMYSVNGYETYASLISFKHHQDGTVASGLFIDDDCEFQIFHPSGGSIGPKDGNPVHDYSGKLVGVNFYGNASEPGVPNPDEKIKRLRINDSVFKRCTARTLWIWAGDDYVVRDNTFEDIGLDATAFANYGIRITHWGSNGLVDNNTFTRGYFGTCGILLSNNNSLRIPENSAITNNKFTDSEGLCTLVNAGYNVSVDGNKYVNCTSSSQIIACFQQSNSQWENVNIARNKITGGSAVYGIYSSANAQDKIEIEDNEFYGFTGFNIALAFYSQLIKGNKSWDSIGSPFYLLASVVGNTQYVGNEVYNADSFAFTGFNTSSSVYKDNIVKNCVSGISVSPGSISEGNYIEGCETDSLRMGVDSKSIGDTIVATANTTDGTDAITNPNGNGGEITRANIISDGSFRYGVNVDGAFSYKVMHSHFSGTFTTGEYRDNGSLTAAINTNDSGAI